MGFPTAIATGFIFGGLASQAAQESIFPLRGVFSTVVQNVMVESFYGGDLTFQQDRGLCVLRRTINSSSFLHCVLCKFRFHATVQSTKCYADFGKDLYAWQNTSICTGLVNLLQILHVVPRVTPSSHRSL